MCLIIFKKLYEDITYDNYSDEESDDDDLEPYYMEEEEEITSAEELKNKIKPPMYVELLYFLNV